LKIKKIALFTLIFTLFTYTLVFAVSLNNFSEGEEVHKNDINIISNMDNSFKSLKYMISSTGASSGIRYRTTAITISVGSYIATIDTMALVNFKPAPGSTVYSQVTVTKEDVIRAIGEQHRAEVTQMLNNPSKYVNIGATIQIYNSGTGAVLATIRNRDDVSRIAEGIGFGSEDIADMKSRFQNNTGNSEHTVIIEPDPNDDGLGPAILVY